MEPDTKLRLILTAEQLFAERGVNGVSLREIGAAAGQRNTGAARYHFGSKEGLLDAVWRHRMEPINEQRLALLAAIEGNDLRALVEAFVYPLSEQLGEPCRPSWYHRFAVHAGFVEGTTPTAIGRDPWTLGLVQLQRRFEAALAELEVPKAVRTERWWLFTGYVAHALAAREQQLQQGKRLGDRARFLAGLVDTAVGLAAAPVSGETASSAPPNGRRRNERAKRANQ